MRSRLKDIAEETGYSVNTVSLALRGSNRVAEATRRKILEVASKHDYVPNSIARSLVARRTHTIGVLLPDIMNPILTATAQLCERLLSAAGYTMVLSTTAQSVEREMRALDVLRAHQVDGALIYPVSHKDVRHIDVLQKTGSPVVLLAGSRAAAHDVVCIDNETGAYLASKHLLGLGYDTVVFLNGAAQIHNPEKLQGYRRALQEADDSLRREAVFDPHGFSFAEGYAVMERVAERHSPPYAVLGSTDALALGAMRWMREHGLRVPQDVAVVGFDDTDAAKFAETPLTSVRNDIRRVSELAVARLLERVSQRSSRDGEGVQERVVIEPELVVRETCGAVVRPPQRGKTKSSGIKRKGQS